MSKEEKAKELYQSSGYNCTQAVLAAFQEETGMSAEDINAFRNTSGGRAEGGVCGAIHAARHLITDPGALAQLEESFVSKAGSINCREIRKKNMLPCRECVGLSAAAAENRFIS